MVMKLKVTVNGDEFSYDGEATLAEILPLLDRWFDVEAQANKAAIDAIAAKLTRSNSTLAGVVDSHDSAS